MIWTVVTCRWTGIYCETSLLAIRIDSIDETILLISSLWCHRLMILSSLHQLHYVQDRIIRGISTNVWEDWTKMFRRKEGKKESAISIKTFLIFGDFMATWSESHIPLFWHNLTKITQRDYPTESSKMLTYKQVKSHYFTTRQNLQLGTDDLFFLMHHRELEIGFVGMRWIFTKCISFCVQFHSRFNSR